MEWRAPVRRIDDPPTRPGPRVLRCANCDIEIREDVVERDGRTFCCDGCAIGGPCVC